MFVLVGVRVGECLDILYLFLQQFIYLLICDSWDMQSLCYSGRGFSQQRKQEESRLQLASA